MQYILFFKVIKVELNNLNQPDINITKFGHFFVVKSLMAFGACYEKEVRFGCQVIKLNSEDFSFKKYTDLINNESNGTNGTKYTLTFSKTPLSHYIDVEKMKENQKNLLNQQKEKEKEATSSSAGPGNNTQAGCGTKSNVLNTNSPEENERLYKLIPCPGKNESTPCEWKKTLVFDKNKRNNPTADGIHHLICTKCKTSHEVKFWETWGPNPEDQRPLKRFRIRRWCERYDIWPLLWFRIFVFSEPSQFAEASEGVRFTFLCRKSDSFTVELWS